jgi:curved DNA-binding protein CbpA
MNLQLALSIFGLSSPDQLSETSLRIRYITLAKERHPDKQGSQAKFVELREAYEYLLAFTKELSSIQSNNAEASDNFITSFLINNEEYLYDQKSVVISKSSYDKHYQLLDYIKVEVLKSIKELEFEKQKLELEKDGLIKSLYSKYFDNFWSNLSKSILGSKISKVLTVNSEQFLKEKLQLELKFEELKNQKDTQTYLLLIKKYGQTLDNMTNNLEIVDNGQTQKRRF